MGVIDPIVGELPRDYIDRVLRDFDERLGTIEAALGIAQDSEPLKLPATVDDKIVKVEAKDGRIEFDGEGLPPDRIIHLIADQDEPRRPLNAMLLQSITDARITCPEQLFFEPSEDGQGRVSLESFTNVKFDPGRTANGDKNIVSSGIRWYMTRGLPPVGVDIRNIHLRDIDAVAFLMNQGKGEDLSRNIRDIQLMYWLIEGVPDHEGFYLGKNANNVDRHDERYVMYDVRVLRNTLRDVGEGIGLVRANGFRIANNHIERVYVPATKDRNGNWRQNVNSGISGGVELQNGQVHKNTVLVSHGAGMSFNCARNGGLVRVTENTIVGAGLLHPDENKRHGDRNKRKRHGIQMTTGNYYLAGNNIQNVPDGYGMYETKHTSARYGEGEDANVFADCAEGDIRRWDVIQRIGTSVR